MTYSEICAIRGEWYRRNYPYKLIYWDDYDYGELSKITWILSRRHTDNIHVNDCYIMCDTETSKKDNGTDHNHVVAWTLSIRYAHVNIVTLWGRKPSDLCSVINFIMLNLHGDQTILYFHNLSYDWQFIRRFIFRQFGYPEKELNTKPHYPVCLTWSNGLVLKDSLILAQRSLDKWAKDYDVEHQKASGKWDYAKIRTQYEDFTQDELEYIEHDTLAGVECLDAMLTALNKNVATAPYTATGIPREGVRKAGKKARARDIFKRYVMTYEDYIMCEKVFHGGYTHADRHQIGYVNEAVCYDFASSYPYIILTHKLPMGKFFFMENKSPDYILRNSDDYAFMFKFIMIRPRLKDDSIPMPALQFSKSVKTINAIQDNGRILCADYCAIYLNETSLKIIRSMYDWDGAICTEVRAASKGYLPDYIRKYIFELFEVKTKLKGGDPVLYALAKAKLNSCYGMMVQKCIKQNITEDFQTGEYITAADDPEELYEKYVKNHNSILLFQWGTWVTSYAMKNLYDLGECVAVDGIWLYSDTDSCYATKWNMDKLNAYNDKCKELTRLAGFGPVEHNGREYWMGVAELDGTYSEYKALGAKRYCCRDAETGKLKITVAGVPKSGVQCLDDNIDNFRRGCIFSGAVTGKLTHSYIYVDDIYIDEKGNETGDSIDLTPCDYLLDDIKIYDWELLFNEEISIQVYEEDTKDEAFI